VNVGAQRAGRTTATDWTPASGATSGAKSPSSLLPDPGSPGLDGTEDAMSLMYELVAKQGQSSMATGQIGVDAQTRSQQGQRARQEAALQQQEADEAKLDTGGGLFGAICHAFVDVGKDLLEGNLVTLPVDSTSDLVNMVDDPHFVAQLEAVAPEVAEYVGVAAAIVGAAALTVASGGTAGIVVAAVVIGLSASGTVVAKTQCLGKDSAYIGLGLEAAGAALSLGASSGVAATGALGTASSVVSGASGAADVLAGASTVVVGHEQADVLDDTADVQQATVAMNRSARMVADLVAGLKEAQTSNKNALQVLAGAAQTYDQTLTLASAAKA